MVDPAIYICGCIQAYQETSSGVDSAEFENRKEFVLKHTFSVPTTFVGRDVTDEQLRPHPQ